MYRILDQDSKCDHEQCSIEQNIRYLQKFYLFRCSDVKYLKNLPMTSIVIIYHNEYPSTLKRTIHSVVNRTPPELLKEIILVNDASTRKELINEIPQYLAENFPKARILNLPTKKGLIVARMEGARNATGEVLVFLDSHVEVNVNWLPPLLGKYSVFNHFHLDYYLL